VLAAVAVPESNEFQNLLFSVTGLLICGTLDRVASLRALQLIVSKPTFQRNYNWKLKLSVCFV